MRSIAASTVAIVVLMFNACSSRPPAAGGPGRTVRSQGELLVITARGEERAVVFGVGRNRDIHFGGGEDAIVGRYSWDGTMSEDDFRAIEAVLEKHDWFAENPDSAGKPETHFYRMTVYRPSGRMRRFEVKGACPALEEVLVICDRSARQRFEPVLDQLPQAGERRR